MFKVSMDQKIFGFGHFSRIKVPSSVIFLLDFATTIASFVELIVKTLIVIEKIGKFF